MSSIVILKTFEDPFYQMTTVLDGTAYAFEFRYNKREEAWYFDIGLPDGTMLVRGVKVVCGLSLLGRFADDRLPPGALFALSSTNDRSAPTMLELGKGKRVELVYAARP